MKSKGVDIDQYRAFVSSKSQYDGNSGFDPHWFPSQCFDFQNHLLDWAIRKGRAAIFADCGMGKTLLQLAWAENVVRHTNEPVLVLTPLAVSHQTVDEGAKFGIECVRSIDGRIPGKIVVTNYERLHHFDRSKFVGVVCDESSILKNFDGVTKAAVTEFMRPMKYRLLCTATAAPNDYIELGTSSEALGYLGFMDMLGKFFKKAGPTLSRGDEFRSGTYRFRGHAESYFWRWVVSWARAIRQPSDLGFENGSFQLPKLITREHVVHAATRRDGFLFDLPAMNLHEQREERRRTLKERCEMAAALVNSHKNSAIAWCHLNDEGDMLERMIRGAVQVSGSDSDERKEEVFRAFEKGEVRAIVSKPSIAAFGLNWQHCAHQTFFPSHSFEQWYQSVRRSWRFGQKQDVTVDVVCSEGEKGVLSNLQRKADAATEMFRRLVELIGKEIDVLESDKHKTEITRPSWL